MKDSPCPRPHPRNSFASQRHRSTSGVLNHPWVMCFTDGVRFMICVSSLCVDAEVVFPNPRISRLPSPILCALDIEGRHMPAA